MCKNTETAILAESSYHFCDFLTPDSLVLHKVIMGALATYRWFKCSNGQCYFKVKGTNHPLMDLHVLYHAIFPFSI